MVRTLCERRLDGDASCLAVLPQGPGHCLLTVGTYNNVAGARSGALCSFDITEGSGELKELGTAPTAAVFDLAWEPAPHFPLLGMAGADGRLHCFRVRRGESLAAAAMECREEAAAGLWGDEGEFGGGGEPPLCTSVDWSPHSPPGGGAGRELATCAQDGRVHVARLAEARLCLEASWEGHSLEAWVARWDAWRPRCLYSGGDDSAFYCWDTAAQAPAFRLRKAHGAGVCAVSCSPHDEFVLATGSYDETFRLWDVRALSQPLETAAVLCGGGVWRIVWHPAERGAALCACMQNGFAVVRGAKVAVSYCAGAAQGQHGSLGYGVQWGAFGRGEGGEEAPPRAPIAISCSFYDRTLRLWEPDAAEEE